MKRVKGFIFFTAIVLGIIGWAAIAWADEIVIGYTGPLSGPAGEYGQDCLNGLEMAVNEINQSGGIIVEGKKYTFRLEKMDDRVNPEIAVSNAIQMRKELKAVAIFNPVYTTIAALSKVNTDKRNEFLLMGYTSVPQASETGNKLYITIVPSFALYNMLFANLAWEKGWRKCAIVTTAGAYGDAWRKIFRTEWEKKGGVVTVDKSTNYYTRTDYAEPLADALKSNPDFMLIGGPSATTALIIEQARAKGYEGGFVLIDQAKFETLSSVMAKPLGLEGTIGACKISSVIFPASPAFTADYTREYKRNLTAEAAMNFTAMHALAKAIVIAGTATDVRAIRAAFPKVFPMLGDKYPYEFFGLTPDARIISVATIQTVKYGKFSQPQLYVWWVKSKKEFEQVKKISKSPVPLLLFSK